MTKTRYTVSVLTKASATFTYEPYRDLLASVENKRDASPAGTISKYAYVNDDLGRRTSVVMTGSAFTNYGDDHHWRWGYNDRSEVTSASWCSGTDLQAACDPAPLSSATYAYDPIGNRTVMTREIIPSPNNEVTVTTDYERNELNQYTSTADSSVYGPGCETEFEYDDDGNMSLADNTCLAPTAYAWDGENRLIRVEPAETPQTGDKKVEFAYDYMSRRVQKKVFVWDTGDWELETDHRFVYDGWNVVLVLDGLDDNAMKTKYTWGLDLSGQRGNPTASGIHGTGGIGGLLAVEETATEGSPKYWFLHDANGNVAQVVQNTTNYPVVAHYEYDAYGNTITATGSYAAANPFRFSTKWRDAETGHYAYTFRYYDPRLGRWMNRDPIQENGGLDVYSAFDNSPIMKVDPLGLVIIGDCRVQKSIRDAGVDMSRLKRRVIAGSSLFEYRLQGAVPPANGWKREIVSRMLWVPHKFKPQWGQAKELEKHIQYRLNVITSARSFKASFGGTNMNSAYWTASGALATKTFSDVSAYAAVNDIWDNPGKYSVQCEAGAILILARAWAQTVGQQEFDKAVSSPIGQTKWWAMNSQWDAGGVNKWDIAIPGDWVYLRKPGNSGVLAGENMIYLGSGNFFGHGGSPAIAPPSTWVWTLTWFWPPKGEFPVLESRRMMVPVGLE